MLLLWPFTGWRGAAGLCYPAITPYWYATRPSGMQPRRILRVSAARVLGRGKQNHRMGRGWKGPLWVNQSIPLP